MSSSPVAIVTGGGSGIGFAIAEHLIQFYGYKVAIFDMDEHRIKESGIQLGDHCLAVHVDVTDYDQQAKAFLKTWEWGGCRLDSVYLNAGIGDTDSLYKDFAIDEQTALPRPLDLRTMDVNLNAVIQGIHLARHFFSEKNTIRGGQIVVTASMFGLYPTHAVPLYSTSKHAVVGLVRSLAPVYAKDSISINALCPALVDTHIIREDIMRQWDPKQLTPLSTILKGIDTIILGDKQLTGKTLELSLGDVNVASQPAFTHPNQKFLCDQDVLWEMVAEPLLPRKPGENI